jgi:phosphatidylinositol glycan class W
MSIKESFFAIAVGFIRFALLSELDYQEHASEYGVHWNFYTTIALINMLLVFVRNANLALPLAFVIMICYEFVIREFSLEPYIFYAPRRDFISGNREGIASLTGYLSLQMIGIGLGNILYKQILTKEDIKELRASKPIEVSP